MKHSHIALGGCLLAAGLLLAASAHASGPENRFLAESSFTQSVKDGYQDLKKDVKSTVNELTGDDKTAAQKFREQRDEDLRTYHEDVQDARKDYVKNRESAQKDYLEHHKELPLNEDLNKDLDAIPAK